MASDRSRPGLMDNRFALVLAGVVLGALWGLVMWGLATLLGNDSGVRGLVYLVLTMAMLGGGVAAFFGVFGVVRRGERVAPRIRRDRDGGEPRG